MAINRLPIKRSNRCELCEHHDRSREGGYHPFGYGWCTNPNSYYYEHETDVSDYCTAWEEKEDEVATI